MANTDSFVEEVTEEVRRDRLFALFRRWAWLAVLIVVAVVGGAAYLEFSRAQDRQQAEAFGSAILDALDSPDAAARIDALGAITPPGEESAVLLALLQAAEAADGEGVAQSAARLREAAATPDLPAIYRDLAHLKAHLIAPLPAAEARQTLEALAQPGAPYAALAEEQLAFLDISEGDLQAGLDRLRALERAAAATPALQQRAGQLVVALESGAQLIDTAPEPDPAPEPEPETAPEETAPVDAPASDAAAPAAVDTPAAETGTDAEAPAGTGPDAEAGADPEIAPETATSDDADVAAPAPEAGDGDDTP